MPSAHPVSAAGHQPRMGPALRPFPSTGRLPAGRLAWAQPQKVKADGASAPAEQLPGEMDSKQPSRDIDT